LAGLSLCRLIIGDIVLVGLAGPLANICLAAALSFILKFGAALPPFAVSLIYQAIVINIVLAVFNLMPIPPLDGSRVAIGLLPSSAARRYAAIEPYGFIILFILLYLRLFDYILWPIVNFMLRLLNMPIP
jgi:Zn-dependent protease